MSTSGSGAPLRRLGRYHLAEPLGGGPIGEVFRAKVYGVAGFERQFAVKRFHAELVRDPKAAAAVSTAARKYGGLDHPRIARLQEYGVAAGETFTAVEMVHGLDASRLIAATYGLGEPLVAGAVTDMISQVARAVGYAHGRGICHLGLCPTNLICTPDGEVKVTDFGFLPSRLPERPGTDFSLHARIPYLAPEQVAGEATSSATDVFQLGAIAYELLTGNRAFAGATPMDVAEAIASAQPALPALARPLLEVMQRSLARSPFERFPDAGALADAIDAAMRATPLPGGRREVAGSVREAMKRAAEMSGAQSGAMSFPLPAPPPSGTIPIDDLPGNAAKPPVKTIMGLPPLPPGARNVDEDGTTQVRNRPKGFVKPRIPPFGVPSTVPSIPRITVQAAPPPAPSATPPSAPPATRPSAPPATKPSAPPAPKPLEPRATEPSAPPATRPPPPRASTRPPFAGPGTFEPDDDAADFSSHEALTREAEPERLADLAARSAFESEADLAVPSQRALSKSDAVPQHVAHIDSIPSGAQPPPPPPSSGRSTPPPIPAVAQPPAPPHPPAPPPQPPQPPAQQPPPPPPFTSPPAEPQPHALSQPFAPPPGSEPQPRPLEPGDPLLAAPSTRKSRLPVVLVIVALLVGAGVGGFFAYQHFTKSEAVASKPKDTPTEPAAAADAGAAKAAAPARDAGAPVATSTADAGAAEPDDDAAADGKLTINSKPDGAKIYIDGSLKGRTPQTLDSTADTFKLALIKPGYKLHTSEVKGTSSVSIKLEEVTPPGGPAGIKVRCHKKNRYYVFVNGHDIGQLCPTERIGVNMGKHVVEIYDPVTDSRRSFRVEVQETRNSLRVRVD